VTELNEDYKGKYLSVFENLLNHSDHFTLFYTGVVCLGHSALTYLKECFIPQRGTLKSGAGISLAHEIRCKSKRGIIWKLYYL
jgi:hypothetical protein